MSHEQIQAAIPHRPPMLLIDEIVEAGQQRIVCRKQFQPDEFFFQGHYPDSPLVPGIILCEVGLQAGAILLSQQLADQQLPADQVPIVTRMNNVKFKRMVGPTDTVEADVSITEQLAGVFFLSARIRCQQQLVASFDFACTVMQRPTEAAAETHE
jgi:3-hydroxyacyl-[acyl-carrier-protein] dehydratase